MSTEQHTPLTAGQLLRQAREQRKLSVAEIALQLNLRVNLVNQIEADQLDSAMLITFVRGYLRAYARLVKLPEQQVLAAYEQQNGGPSNEPAKPMRSFSNRTGLQATENRFMWITYAIGFILVLMLVVWWWQTASPNADSAADHQQELSTPAVSNNEADTVQNAEMSDSVSESSISEVEPPAISQSDVVAADAMPEFANVAPSQPDVITMEFKENCWIDVLDAEGNRIAFGTKQAGYKMTVTGAAPFVVTLGNPSVVLVTLNNQPFDLSSLPAGRVAKFTLAETD